MMRSRWAGSLPSECKRCSRWCVRSSSLRGCEPVELPAIIEDMRRHWAWASVALLVSTGCTTGSASDGTVNSFAGSNASATGGERTATVATGATPESVGSNDAVATAAGGSTISPAGSIALEGADQEHPVGRCGPRDSYYYVATEYRCRDGSNPLGGNVAAGRDARLGNVGANSTGHIIDLYEVPCASGAQRVYVDMYHCPPGVNPLIGP